MLKSVFVQKDDKHKKNKVVNLQAGKGTLYKPTFSQNY